MTASLEPTPTVTMRSDAETIATTLREIESLLLTAQQTLSATVSLKDPSLKSLCRARVRVLFLLLQLFPSHLSTLEWFKYQSHSSILRRYLQGAQ